MWPQAQAALRFLFSGPRWQGTHAVGAATSLGFEGLLAALGYVLSGDAGIGIAPLGVAVNFPLLGYALRVFRRAMAGGPDELPDWGGWSSLTAEGLLAFVVGLGYGLVPLLMVLAGLGLLVKGGMFVVTAGSLMVLGLLSALILMFFLPMAVASFLAEERIEAAFVPATLWLAIGRRLGDYAGAYALGVGSFVLAGAAASVPLAGPLFTPFIAFPLLVFFARIFGQTCGIALRPDPQS